VRALARDIGRRLGCCGHVKALGRTRVGPFCEEDSITLDELRDAAAPENGSDIGQFLLPVEAALTEVPELSVSQQDASNLAMGRAVLIRGRDAPLVSGPVYATFKLSLIHI